MCVSVCLTMCVCVFVCVSVSVSVCGACDWIYEIHPSFMGVQTFQQYSMAEYIN